MNIKISGYFTQYLEVDIPPDGSFISEVGAMTYFEESISTELLISNNGIMGFIKRVFSGENIALVKYINASNSNKKLVLSSNGVLHPIKIGEYSNELICAKTSFFASSKDIKISVNVSNSITTSLFGGLGIFRQKITGNGTVFLKANGEIKKIDLNGDKIIIDSSSILAFTKDLNFTSNLNNPIKNWMSGEGGSSEGISGFGTIWIQCYNDPVKSKPLLNLYTWGIIIFYIIYFVFFK